jgi:hypothetical protein
MSSKARAIELPNVKVVPCACDKRQYHVYADDQLRTRDGCVSKIAAAAIAKVLRRAAIRSMGDAK